MRRPADELLPFGVTRRAQIVQLVINDAQRLCDEQCGSAEQVQRDQPAIEKTHTGFVLTSNRSVGFQFRSGFRVDLLQRAHRFAAGQPVQAFSHVHQFRDGRPGVLAQPREEIGGENLHRRT